MRLRRHETSEEPSRARAGRQAIFPDRPRRPVPVPEPEPEEPELSTAAERAAARRRLDRLADEF